MKAMNRRAFLSAIAGAAIAPHLRVALPEKPEAHYCLSFELLTLLLGEDWPTITLPRSWTWHVAKNSFTIPRRDVRLLIQGYMDRHELSWRIHSEGDRLIVTTNFWRFVMFEPTTPAQWPARSGQKGERRFPSPAIY